MKERKKLIFIDIPNILKSSEEVFGKCLSDSAFEKLRNYLTSIWSIEKIYMYDTISEKDENKKYTHSQWESYGYVVFPVTVKKLPDGSYKGGEDLDVEMARNIMKEAYRYSPEAIEFVLFTGDHVFVSTVHDLKTLRYFVTVVSFSHSLASKLKSETDYREDLELIIRTMMKKEQEIADAETQKIIGQTTLTQEEKKEKIEKLPRRTIPFSN